MSFNRNLGVCFMLAFVISFFVILPASATDADFDWEIYKINTNDWESTTKYLSYEGIIYEVHFFDETSGSVKSWNWEFGDSDWTGSTKEDPVKIFTEEEVEDEDYTIKVILSIVDSSGSGSEVSHTVYFDPEDPWNLKTIYTLTPEPTATPTPVPTTVPQTTAPTVAPTPTPEPTPLASHTFEIPGISKEMTKLQDTFEDYIGIIKALLGIK